MSFYEGLNESYCRGSQCFNSNFIFQVVKEKNAIKSLENIIMYQVILKAVKATRSFYDIFINIL